jgi:hypothetical protein
MVTQQEILQLQVVRPAYSLPDMTVLTVGPNPNTLGIDRFVAQDDLGDYDSGLRQVVEDPKYGFHVFEQDGFGAWIGPAVAPHIPITGITDSENHRILWMFETFRDSHTSALRPAPWKPHTAERLIQNTAFFDKVEDYIAHVTRRNDPDAQFYMMIGRDRGIGINPKTTFPHAGQSQEPFHGHIVQKFEVGNYPHRSLDIRRQDDLHCFAMFADFAGRGSALHYSNELAKFGTPILYYQRVGTENVVEIERVGHTFSSLAEAVAQTYTLQKMLRPTWRQHNDIVAGYEYRIGDSSTPVLNASAPTFSVTLLTERERKALELPEHQNILVRMGVGSPLWERRSFIAEQVMTTLRVE